MELIVCSLCAPRLLAGLDLEVLVLKGYRSLMSDLRYWIVYAGAWREVFGFMLGTYFERRANSKFRQDEEKLRAAAMPNPEVRGEMSLVPPLYSGRDSYEYGRLMAQVQFHDSDLRGIGARIEKLE